MKITNARLILVTSALVLSGVARAEAQAPDNRRDQVLLVHAQDPKPALDVSGGYTLMRDSGRGQTMPAAWIVGISFRVTPRWSAVGEADGAYKSVNTSLGTQEYRTHAFMGGVRRHLAATTTRAPFVQALAGNSCYCGSTVQPDGRFSRGLAVQLGGGVDFAVVRGLGLRLQGDFRHVNGDGLGFSQFRLAVGAVVGVLHR